MAPKRVLHVLGGTSLGGAESRIMDLYRHTDRSAVQFDFLVHSDEQPRKPQFFDDEIMRLGGRIYVLPKMKLYNYREYIKAVRKFFHAHHDFAAVHGHMTSTAGIYLPIAKKCGVAWTIAHARSAGVDKGAKGIATRLLRVGLADKADACFACSAEAAISVFGRKAYEAGRVVIFPNAIDSEKFIFNEAVRHTIRKELGIEDCFVVGHVGRFHYAKNHEFLVRAFARFREIYERQAGRKTVLLLLGEGPLMEQTKELCETLSVRENVIFAGNRSNVEDYYNAMDLFCFPSRFEGLPGTVVEAQANGLTCLVSDSVTKEVKLSDRVCYESLGRGEEHFAKVMLAKALYPEKRQSHREEIVEAGFDAKEQAGKLQEYYLHRKGL